MICKITARKTTFTLMFALGVFMSLQMPTASAEQWPDKPIRVILPLPPGGPSDIVLRGAAPKVQQTLGQPLVLDNKPGANGNIGAAEAARAKPDGYTWLWMTDTTLTVNPHVYEKMAFKASDFTPVMRATTFSQTLVCNPKVGVKTIAEFVKRAKETSLTYASGGAGSPGHLTTEQFITATGIHLTHVPYKGPAPAVQDMLGGQVDCGFLAGPTVLPHIKSGRLVALAVSGTKRSLLLPDVPTVPEAGYPKFDATFALVLFAPKGTPVAIINKMHDALSVALKTNEMADKLAQADLSIEVDSPAATAERLAQDTKRWAEVAKKINLHLD